jgi:hypothetical protein
MTHHDPKAAIATSAGSSDALRVVSAPTASQGVRNALRGAFACTAELPDEFDRLLARLR